MMRCQGVVLGSDRRCEAPAAFNVRMTAGFGVLTSKVDVRLCGVCKGNYVGAPIKAKRQLGLFDGDLVKGAR